jgi:hypothetical protein
MNPLKYGRLLDQTDNKYIVQVNKTNMAIIVQHEDYNEVSFFKQGD